MKSDKTVTQEIIMKKPVEKDYPLLTVYVVACTCMMTIQILGSYYDRLNPKEKVARYVSCGVDVLSIADNINLRLAGECEVYE
jgi:hypothetical protein